MDNIEYNLLTKWQIMEKSDNMLDYTRRLENEFKKAEQKISELERENCSLYEQGYSEGYDDGVQTALECGDKDDQDY